jgi:hypothetical protein
MPNHQPGNLDYALAGMSYPATYWQILAWADYNCATSKLRHVLWQLPHKTYVNQRAIVAALWEQPGGVAACNPPPRTQGAAHRKASGHHGHIPTYAEVRWIA